ncbi:glycoside hydrolase family 9 protein [Ruminococcus sp.]|uniref:glycoside hydrolase family 9 protein n=2 Tax=Ruminococcus sp. TaxID=41978 RepID=UPI002CE8DD40|nr:glycoside hydrolase family 9 protein [Ruminococcus sp.]HNZ98798.1 glycoside hydrolase family 9 protein [Ruminococcus sp.]
MRIVKKISALAAAAVTALSAVPCTFTADAAATPYKADYEETDNNWAKVLQYTLHFYDANMCGTDVTGKSRFSWRGNCHVYDSKVPMHPIDDNHTGVNMSESFMEKYKDILDPDGDGYIDVSGGFHDAGDHVKFGLPEAYAASVVSWGYYEFRQAYEETDQAEHVETICRHFCDYFMRSTFRDDKGDVIAFCYQVGDGSVDHEYWQSPEIDAMGRPAFFATSSLPTTDDVSESAAALAINYLNFKETDPEYAKKCLDYSKALFDFANKNEKKVGAGGDGPASFYTSSKWEDDFCFAAGWLYLITKDHDYLEACEKYIDYYAPPGYVLCWNDMWNGVGLVFGRIQDIYPEVCAETRDARGYNQYEVLDFWKMQAKALNEVTSGKKGEISPGGYLYLDKWGSARYNTAVQFTALVYDKYNKGKDKYNEKNPDYTFTDWAIGQMEYIIGDNPLGRCYIVGYGENAVKNPHHRAASGLTMAEDTAPQKHVLYGALAGGPDAKDQHVDLTKDWIYNEVTIDYNAAIVGAAAGMYLAKNDGTMKPEADFPPAEKADDTQLFSGDDFYVAGYCSDAPEKTGAGVTKLTFFVKTDSLEPHEDISIRYYFSIEEFDKKEIPGSFVLQKTYDQVETEVTGKAAVLSQPKQYKDDIYYIEISWPEYAIANSNKKYQLIIGNYYGENWDSSNDWSKKGMIDLTKEGEDYDNIVSGVEFAQRCENVCVYADGKLVGGTEPDGTKPPKVYKVAQLVRLRRMLLGLDPFASEEVAMQFDFNSDGNVDVYDEVELRKLLVSQAK